MKLSRKKAIELCIELWKWLAKTGKQKMAWPGWKKYGYEITALCWFCEYGEKQLLRYGKDVHRCYYCPLHLGHIGCRRGPCAYNEWALARTSRTRKKYAKLFLAQIRSLK